MLDLNKPVQVVDGSPCRILATDLAGNFPLAVAVMDAGSKTERIRSYKLDGKFRGDGKDSDIDLINVPNSAASILRSIRWLRSY